MLVALGGKAYMASSSASTCMVIRAFETTLVSGHLPGLDYLAIYHDSKHKSGQQDNHTEEIVSKLLCSILSIYLMLC